MKKGSIIAYEGEGINYAEVFAFFICGNGEIGLKIIQFGKNYTIEICESEAWLLADNL